MYPDSMINGENQRRQEMPAAPGCDARTVFGRCTFPSAMVYTPMQTFDNLYDKDSALRAGTIFRELDLPFHGRSVANGGTT